MKNRIWKKAGSVCMAAAILAAAAGNSGEMAVVRAADVDNPAIRLEQSAQWTDPEQYRGEITMEISGLKAYAEKYARNREYVLEEETADPAEQNGEENLWNEEDTGTANESGEAAFAGVTDFAENPEEECTEEISDPEEEYAEEMPDTKEEYAEEITDPKVVYGDRLEEWTEEEFAEAAKIEQEEVFLLTEDNMTEAIYNEATGELFETPVPELILVNYISEYFQPDTALLPQSCQMESIAVRNQKGEDTAVTKITYPIDLSVFTEDVLRITFPVILNEEYHTAETAIQYPVCQDEPLNKDCPGPGAFVLQKTETESIVVAGAASPVLEVAGSACDFSMELIPGVPEIKAGQPFTYELAVTNTGELPLTDMLIESRFNLEKVKAVWESVQGLEVNGTQAVLAKLEKGETSVLRMTAQPAECQSGELVHSVSVKTFRPGNEAEAIIHETTASVSILPLKADFTVEKTADRTQAYPGETITYQICIRNTGERTLHSVISTEKFINANIQAQFQQKPGVVLNSSRTQALIPEIAPGQAFALLASVTLPQYIGSGELINEVTVVSEETGSRSIESQSEITVTGYSVTPTQYPEQMYYQSGNGTKSSGAAYYPASKPKTGDETEIGLLLLLLILAASAVISGVIQLKGKSRH